MGEGSYSGKRFDIVPVLARIEEKRNAYRILVGNPEERGH
jgi:hypothetical protein